MSAILIKVLFLYHRYLSPLKGPTCRFYPSCSQYAIEALRKYRLGKASYLIIGRILRCHPWHPGGYDPLK